MHYHDILGDPPSKAQMATLDRRKIEAEILKRINRALKRCQTERKGDVNYVKAVIKKNNAIWTQFSNAVLDPENQLSGELRKGIFNLAKFVHQHGSLVIEGQATVDALIAVNHDVAQGLAGIK